MAKKDSPKQDRATRGRLVAYQARQEAFERSRARRKRDNRTWAIAGAAIVVLAIGSQVGFALSGSGSSPSASPTTGALKVPSPDLAAGKTWTGTLGINNIALVVSLDGTKAPQAVSSTLSLAQSGFYRNVKCHRLTTEGIFVLQCGDPKGDGTGGPGYSYGPVENAPADNIYPAGTIAMARQGNNDHSQGSQFFIVYKDSMIPSDSAGGYTVIGKVSSGLAQLNQNVVAAGTSSGAGDGTPKQTTIINYFDILPQ